MATMSSDSEVMMPLRVLEVMRRGDSFSQVMTWGLIVHYEQVSCVWLLCDSFIMFNLG